MANSSRKTALAALNDVTQNEGYSNIVIDKAIRAAGLEPRDAAGRDRFLSRKDAGVRARGEVRY